MGRSSWLLRGLYLSSSLCTFRKCTFGLAHDSEQDKFEIVQWLFKDDFKAITFDDQKDILYYVMFTKGSSYQNGFKQGYLNLTMELNAPCGFTNITTDVMRVQEETTFEIFNRTNVEAFSYPDVEFELIGETDWIEIENLTTGDVMRFEGLNPSTHAYCYNEGLKQHAVLVPIPICMNDRNSIYSWNFIKVYII